MKKADVCLSAPHAGSAAGGRQVETNEEEEEEGEEGEEDVQSVRV
jgi:hypothetical protein